MKKYLLDTCALIWYLEGSKRVKSIAEKIEYYDGDFAISVESLREIIHKIQIGKLEIDIPFMELVDMLKERGISIMGIELNALNKLYNIPMYKGHKDPHDRLIISQAILYKRTLITGDEKFYQYDDLELLQV